MTQHAYARVAGFKLAVIPRAPFRMTIANEPPNAIDVEYFSPNGKLFARVIPDHEGYKSKIDQRTPSLLAVLDIHSGPDIAQWRIETTKFTCEWPNDYAVCSNRFPEDPAPFDFVGPHKEMIYVQDPPNVPDVAAMCAPNQTVIHIERNVESDRIELAYEHAGSRWRQRHEVVAFLDRRIVVTMQSPLPFAEQASAAAHSVACSVRPYEFA